MDESQRKIIHVDMDAFYASIEMRDHPEYRHQPLVIARDPRTSGGRGVVATANYLARAAGIHSAMSAQEALERCKEAVFKQPDFTKYRAVSQQIHDIFHEVTDKIESVALDEAYLDITENKLDLDNPIEVGLFLQQKIWQETRLTSSIGISYNKFLAKEASDYRKPVGMTIIKEEDAHDFLMKLPIEKYRGVGKKTVPKMHELKVFTGADLYQLSENQLMHDFGKFGYMLYRRVRGIDDRPVEYLRERKSIGKERTYGQSLADETSVANQINFLSDLVSDTVQKQQKHGRTLVLKIRYQDFTTLTKRYTSKDFLPNDPKVFAQYANQLLEEMPDIERGVRLLGITITGLAPLDFDNISLPLFEIKGKDL